MTAEPVPSGVVGHPRPRIAPPLPLRHDLDGYRETAASLDITPMPWQEVAAKYATAKGTADRLLYRDVAIVVARQQGKTTLAKPLIVDRLKRGRHIMHIAQLRELPRIMFEQIADSLEATDPDLFPRRRGKIIWPRRGAGSESIVLTNGGSYRIAAAITGAARGHSIDDLLIDELREMESFAVINSAKPAQRFSEDPQTIYLSNAGTDDSVVLNSLRARADGDPGLAYLEWSAAPEYDAGDIRGWVQANPAIGHYPQVLRDLEADYLAAKLGGNMAGFETESLCRWVPSMRERLVDEYAWMACRGPIGKPVRPMLGVSTTPDGTRAAAAVAWQLPDGMIALQVVAGFEDSGDLRTFADELKTVKAVNVAYDPMTDAELAKHLRKPRKVSGLEFANASALFVNLVNAGRLRWANADQVSGDLAWTARKEFDDQRFTAVRMSDDHSISAALAAIRAVWLASGPSSPSPRIY